MDILDVCPHLVMQNSEFTSWCGFLVVQGESFQIKIQLQQPDSLDGASFRCDWKLKNLLKNYNRLLNQRLLQCMNLRAFLVELISLIENELSGENSTLAQSSTPKFYHQLTEQIEDLGWDKLVFIDSNFQQLYLLATDQKHRKHTLKVKLHKQHPEIGPDCCAEIPGVFDPIWNTKSTLKTLYSQFTSCVNQHQDYWDQMDEIDKKTWVLEPDQPTRNCTTRRIALGNSASLHIEVDTRHPRMFPVCCFLGADHAVGPLREKANTNLHNWLSTNSLLLNLQELLEMEFPSPQNTKKEDFSAECGICYAYRLDGCIPDQVCDSPQCAQPFHHMCLYEWLRSVATSRQSFNVLFGECPYCNRSITVKMPSR